MLLNTYGIPMMPEKSSMEPKMKKNFKGYRYPHNWEGFSDKMSNYMKIPFHLKEKLYGKKAFYVNVMVKGPDDDCEKKHIMGP